MRKKETIFSECRKYRYTLWREFSDLLTPDTGRYVQFIGLNPSTADEIKDDATVRRCINFSKQWGFDAYCMTNIFAWRDTKPEDMKKAADPIGPDNDKWIVEIAKEAGLVVAAWGNHGLHLGRSKQVIELLRDVCELKCFNITQAGQPEHPLYQPRDAKLISLKS